MGGQSSGGAIIENAFGAAVALISELPVLSQPEADQIAKARFNALGLELITGEGRCWGRTDLRSGSVIKIDGVGERFGGNYYVILPMLPELRPVEDFEPALSTEYSSKDGNIAGEPLRQLLLSAGDEIQRFR